MVLKLQLCVALCALLLLVPSSVSSESERECGPNFCDGIKFACLKVTCGPNEMKVGSVKKREPPVQKTLQNISYNMNMQ
ncbi:hypothetical protein NQ315_017268 [Exocentrus adspersus]|uniref:Uncharacterized protein n=1 Tax=Exocentrus adspersus TaxID=1586481 RepID=A0AAV8VFY4_9CUCU|nr:hypothetical protein NQ315_017268 [Exocentrus adspersus]